MYSCQRFSNNSKPEFTDEEVMTIYLYAMHIEQRFKVKQIYEYASDHLRWWFPLLPSYEAFNMRPNRLGEALLDSMPIITCSGGKNQFIPFPIAI